MFRASRNVRYDVDFERGGAAAAVSDLKDLRVEHTDSPALVLVEWQSVLACNVCLN